MRFFILLFILSLSVACSSNTKAPTESQSSPVKKVYVPPDTCSNCIEVDDVPILNGTTFPFACEPTADHDLANKVTSCIGEQFMDLSETHRPSRRLERRDLVGGNRAPTNYPYYPETRFYLSNGRHWYIFTECGVDELVQTNDPNPLDNDPGGLTYTDNLGNRYFHPAEDWNLSVANNIDDNNEHVYAIGDGLVLSRGNNASFGNTIQIVHRICPPRQVNPNCEYVVSSYSHLNARDWANAPRIGDRVTKGQAIARIGATGRGAGSPHLHLEIRRSSALQRVNINSAPDNNGDYLRPHPNFPVYHWPGLDAAFIRENYEDPTEFIKRHAGLLLHYEHHSTGSNINPQPAPRRIVLPEAGIVIFELNYPPGNIGQTHYNLVVRNDDADRSLRLSGNKRPLANWRGDQRHVIWGERDRPSEAEWVFHVGVEVENNIHDAPNTPFHLSVTLHPYNNNDNDKFPKLRPFPTRALYFDRDDVFRNVDPDESPSHAWFHEHTQNLYDFGIIGGYGRAEANGCPSEPGQLCPGNFISQIEFFQILMTAINATYHDRYNMPNDLDGSEWYAKALATALDWNILNLNDIDTSGDGILQDPELLRLLTRREAARYITRAFKINQDWWWQNISVHTLDNPFPDIDNDDSDYKNILAAYYSISDDVGDDDDRVISGYDQASPDGVCLADWFCPDANIKRSEMATMISRALRIRINSFL